MASDQSVSKISLQPNGSLLPTGGAAIVQAAEDKGLDPRNLYEAVIDLTSEGLYTAACINLAAGILVQDLGLPEYFFRNIKGDELVSLLRSIASNIQIKDNQVILLGRVAHVAFESIKLSGNQKVRIATQDTRDNMEAMLEPDISGHRREYYFGPEKQYYTYLIRPYTISDFPTNTFLEHRFLFDVEEAQLRPPDTTRNRYEDFLKATEKSVTPLISVDGLPETGETRIMFKSDFTSPQLPLLRRLLEDHGFGLARAYWEPYYSPGKQTTSICSLYLQDELTKNQETELVRDLRDFLCFAINHISDLYLDGTLSYREMLFAGNIIDFTHLFIFNEYEQENDIEIFSHLDQQDFKESFARRLHDSNKFKYNYALIEETVRDNPDLLGYLYTLFEKRFNPEIPDRIKQEQLEEERKLFINKISSVFLNYPVGYDIFIFMFDAVAWIIKTNFYLTEKRSFSFRFDNRVLDPLVFNQYVFGI